MVLLHGCSLKLLGKHAVVNRFCPGIGKVLLINFEFSIRFAAFFSSFSFSFLSNLFLMSFLFRISPPSPEKKPFFSLWAFFLYFWYHPSDNLHDVSFWGEGKGAMSLGFRFFRFCCSRKLNLFSSSDGWVMVFQIVNRLKGSEEFSSPPPCVSYFYSYSEAKLSLLIFGNHSPVSGSDAIFERKTRQRDNQMPFHAVKTGNEEESCFHGENLSCMHLGMVWATP